MQLFGAVKLTKIAYLNRYFYSEYGIGFDSCSHCSFPNFDWGRNVVIFEVDNGSLVHIDNKKGYGSPR